MFCFVLLVSTPFGKASQFWSSGYKKKKTKKREQENMRIKEKKEWQQDELRGERKRGFRKLKW